MWASIKNIEQPQSLSDAYALYQADTSAFLAGGTYLVPDKSSKIETLIDINQCLKSEIICEDGTIVVHAGTTLQSFVNQFAGKTPAQCALFSCYSKNIRNQRTIGGEIAWGRVNSEVFVALCALDAKLSICTNEVKEISIREYKEGIISKISISADKLTNLQLQRSSVIPSAPAFTIIAATVSDAHIHCSIGGKAERISHFAISVDEWYDKIEKTSEETIKHFASDHYGSKEYKKAAIKAGLKRIGKQLCK